MLPQSVCFQKAGTLPLMETQLTNEALMTKRTEGFSLFLSFEEKIPPDTPNATASFSLILSALSSWLSLSH